MAEGARLLLGAGGLLSCRENFFIIIIREDLPPLQTTTSTLLTWLWIEMVPQQREVNQSAPTSRPLLLHILTHSLNHLWTEGSRADGGLD